MVKEEWLWQMNRSLSDIIPDGYKLLEEITIDY